FVPGSQTCCCFKTLALCRFIKKPIVEAVSMRSSAPSDAYNACSHRLLLATAGPYLLVIAQPMHQRSLFLLFLFVRLPAWHSQHQASPAPPPYLHVPRQPWLFRVPQFC